MGYLLLVFLGNLTCCLIFNIFVMILSGQGRQPVQIDQCKECIFLFELANLTCYHIYIYIY